MGPVTIPLNHDQLTLLTVAMPNTVIPGSKGQLDAKGTATAKVVVPTGLDSGLIGLRVHTAFVTYTGGGVHLASNPQSLTLVQ